MQGEARSAQQMQGFREHLQGTNDRDAAFDTLTARIGAALATDQTLGGLCDWVAVLTP